MTETNMILSNPYHGERRAGFVGLPLPGVEVRVVPEDGADSAQSSGHQFILPAPATHHVSTGHPAGCILDVLLPRD